MLLKELTNLIKEVNQRMIGGNGGVVLSGSNSVVTGQFFAIQSIGTTAKLDAVIGDPDVSGLEIPVGATIYGRFQSVTSGADATDVFICYKL